MAQESHIPSLSFSVPRVPDGESFYLAACGVAEMLSAGHTGHTVKPSPLPSAACPGPENSLSAWAPGRRTGKRLPCRSGGGMRQGFKVIEIHVLWI